MPKQPDIKLGDIVAITFLDHSAKSDALLKFTAHGKVSVITDASITVDCWHYADTSERDENVERFTIARQVIEKVETLAVATTWPDNGWRADGVLGGYAGHNYGHALRQVTARNCGVVGWHCVRRVRRWMGGMATKGAAH